MTILNPTTLRIHVVNVDHGDAIIIEFPDYDGMAHVGIVDTGRPEIAYRDRLAAYLAELIRLREMPYEVEFICITHPHEDHYGGLNRLLDSLAADGATIRQFWDCGFRTSAMTYNRMLERIAADDRIVFVRLAAGAEFEYGEARVFVLAPSLDLRNRFDTYGVDRNNASVVLRLIYRDATAILAGDAHFDSWGKVVEEFPRTTKISFFEDARVERSEGSNQLKCQLLKVSHHGSKHGTSLEYLEKLDPSHFMITCGDAAWYTRFKPGWGIDWPHPLTREAIQELTNSPNIRFSFQDGNIIYSLRGGGVDRTDAIPEKPGEAGFSSKLEAVLAN